MHDGLLARDDLAGDAFAAQANPAVARLSHYVPQGISADLLATLDGYTRATEGAVLVEPGGYLASQLQAEPGWTPLYRDGVSALFGRRPVPEAAASPSSGKTP